MTVYGQCDYKPCSQRFEAETMREFHSLADNHRDSHLAGLRELALVEASVMVVDGPTGTPDVTYTTPYVIPEELETAREFWRSIAIKNGWDSNPFYVQVWVDGEGNVTDSVSVRGMTQDHIVPEGSWTTDIGDDPFERYTDAELEAMEQDSALSAEELEALNAELEARGYERDTDDPFDMPADGNREA